VTRLDNYLVENEFVDSRNKAQALIKEGLVFVNATAIHKSSHKVSVLDEVKVAKHKSYVSRAAHKLNESLNELDLDINARIALDIGSSTGGFTQVLLERNVKEVSAVDVGRDQLHQSLKNDSRVYSFESCDIRDFKSDKDSYPRIAISVDMLDTGIDVPEIVNLVFAKPIRSLVKFEQMIGRGTRLCPDLFGNGKNKTHFRIFDLWGNFEFFDRHYKKAEPTVSKSLMQQVFEARLDMACTALKKSVPDAFEPMISLIREDLERLSEETISVREKWREKRLSDRKSRKFNMPLLAVE